MTGGCSRLLRFFYDEVEGSSFTCAVLPCDWRVVQELDALDEPKKKEIAEMRKKIELVDRELRPLKALSERKVTEKEVRVRVRVRFNREQLLKDRSILTCVHVYIHVHVHMYVRICTYILVYTCVCMI